MTTFPRLAAAALLAGALIPATASAAPDHSSGLIDKDKTTFEWDSKLGTGFVAINTLKPKVPCGTPGVHDCDTTLVHVNGFGSITVENSSADPNAIDTDLYLYSSDENGTLGDQLSSSAQSNPTPTEAVGAETAEGDNWFLVEIDYSVNVGGTIHGKVTYTPSVPEPEAAPEGAAF
jgi:hypothetical protein